MFDTSFSKHWKHLLGPVIPDELAYEHKRLSRWLDWKNMEDVGDCDGFMLKLLTWPEAFEPFNTVDDHSPICIPFQTVLSHLFLHATRSDEDSDYPHFLSGRRFAVLAGGKLAFVPTASREGDIDCYLKGGILVPFVLRPTGKVFECGAIDKEFREKTTRALEK